MILYLQMLWNQGKTINVNFGESELMVVHSKGLIIILPVWIWLTQSSLVKVNSAKNQVLVALFVFLLILTSEILIKLEVSIPSGFYFLFITSACKSTKEKLYLQM